MSETNNWSQQTDADFNDSSAKVVEQEPLSTGYDTLDQNFVAGGFVPGNLVNVVSEQSAPGDAVLAGLMANRPTFYYSLGKTADILQEQLVDHPNVSVSKTKITTLKSADDLIPVMNKHLNNENYPSRANIIINPANQLENEDYEAYQGLLQTLSGVVNQINGLGFIQTVESKEAPKNRFMTNYHSENIIRVRRNRVNNMIKTQLVIEKLHPKQSLIEGSRTFELAAAGELEIKSMRNITV